VEVYTARSFTVLRGQCVPSYKSQNADWANVPFQRFCSQTIIELSKICG
jgi:hypothetical protein